MRRLLSIATLLTLAAGNASATVPSSFSVQGVLRDNTGKLQSMAITVTANIFADQMGGTALNTAPFIANNVMAVNGLFTVTFSDAMLIANLSSTPSGQLWLEVTVGNDTFPRQQITPGVWALMSAQADNALQLGGKPPSSYALASQLTGGTVTSVATGTGLAGGPVTTSGTISVDFALVAHAVHTHTVGDYKQSATASGQVSSCCPAGTNIISGGCYINSGYITGSFISANCWYCNFAPNTGAAEDCHAYCM